MTEESTAIAVNTPTPIATPIVKRQRHWHVPRSIDDAMMLADILGKSGLVPVGIGTPQAAMVVMMQGEELGLSPFQALNGIDIINGKTSTSAEVMVGLVRRSGLCEKFDIVESTLETCTIEAKRIGGSELSITWTIDQASKVTIPKGGFLTSKAVWKNYPRAMLRHRCEAEICRALWPDVVAGLYDHEELEDMRRESRDDTVELRANKSQAMIDSAIKYPVPASDPEFSDGSELRRKEAAAEIHEDSIGPKPDADQNEVKDDGIPDGLRPLVDAKLLTQNQAIWLLLEYDVATPVQLHMHLSNGLKITRMGEHSPKMRTIANHLKALPDVIEYEAQKAAHEEQSRADAEDVSDIP